MSEKNNDEIEFIKQVESEVSSQERCTSLKHDYLIYLIFALFVGFLCSFIVVGFK